MNPESTSTSHRRYAVLVIEDDEVDRMAVRRAIGQSCLVNEVDSLTKARSAHIDTPAQCVLLDLNLRDSQGLRTVTRAKEIFTDVPVVVLTGMEEDELGPRSLQLGAQDFFPKSQIARAPLTRVIRYAIERQAVLKTLHDSSQQWRSIMQSVPDVVMTTDRRGIVTYVSRSFMGRSPHEIVGTFMPDLFPESQAQMIARAIDRVVADGVQQVFETSLPDHDGTEAWLNVRVGSFVRESSVAGAVAVIRDTTETQRLKVQVQHAQRMEALGRLAGGVAHDLNNLLTVIIGAAELLGESMSRDDPRQNDIADVLDASERITRLTEQLLAFARRRIASPERVNVAHALPELDAILRRSIGSGIELSIVTPPVPWEVRLDRIQFDQVLLNLAVNGRDAMPGGGTLTIEARNAFDHEPLGGLPRGDYVILEVRDEGVGIAPEIREHLFEPFFTTKGSDGTGLGLATCFGIVDQAGGRIEVDSEPGKGATFRVLLPRAVEPTSQSPSPPVDRRSIQATVLVAGERSTAADGASALLRAAGLRVDEARSLEQALERLAQYPTPDLVVCEDPLAAAAWTELARALRGRLPGLPVLLLADDAGGDDAAALRETTLPFLTRPYSRDALVRAVRELVERGQPIRPNAAKPDPANV